MIWSINKSWTRAGTIQDLLIDVDQRILLINAKLENAVDILADIRMDFETNELLRWLFPEYCVDLVPKERSRRCKWGTSRLDFPNSKYAGRREGNIQVLGVEASLVSKHYDLLIFDDPVNDINTATKDYRDKIHRWYRNALQLRVSTKSRIRLIGTRWHFDDLYSRLIKQEIKRRKIQKENTGKVRPRYLIYHRAVVEKVEVGGESIVGYDDVQPIWPERFTKEDIEQLREENGSYIFSCQFMNNPLPEEDAIFKHSDIIEIDEFEIPEEVVNFMAIDLALEDTNYGDFTVITVASFDAEGKMYVRRIVRDKLLPSRLLEIINNLVQRYDVQRVGIETTAFQKALYKVYKGMAVSKGYSIPWVEMERGKTSKLKRIISMQPRVERGDFLVEEGIENMDNMVDEMTTYPRSPHDDILDTLADLEAIFFNAPQVMEAVIPQDTYDAFYGPLDEGDGSEDDEDYGDSVIDGTFGWLHSEVA